MNNSTSTTLEGVALLVNQLELVVPTTVAGTLYGIAFTIFCLYVHALTPRLRKGDRTRQAKFMLGYSTVIMLCGLYNLVSNAWVTQDAYIKHSSYPDGPFAYIINNVLTIPGMLLGLGCQIVIDVFTSTIQIWRVWVIWSATRYAKFVTVLPALCLLACIGIWLRNVVLDVTTPLAVRERDPADNILEQASVAIRAATTILCTAFISGYLIYKHWQQRRLIGKSQGYTGYGEIVAIMIESYALESIWLLAAVILWNQPSVEFFGESVINIEIIAYLLVFYRVASGKSYGSQRERRNISSLHWNRSNHATTQFGEAGQIQGSHHVSGIPEAPDAPGVSSMA